MFREEYRAAFGFLREHRRMLRWVTILFLSATLLSGAALWVVFGNDPALLEQLMQQVAELFASKEIMDEAGQINALRLFLSNFWASSLALLYGVFPFLFLPLLLLLFNAVLIGVVSATALRLGFPPLALIASLLPHGIFEIPALLLSCTMGIILCRSIVRRILRRPEPQRFLALVHELLRASVLIVVPLLAVAAVIESYVTGAIASLFL